MTIPLNNHALRASLPSRHFLKHHPVESEPRHNRKKPLRVIKFGGTSVGDASCIAKVLEIIRTASKESQVVVVVSALSGMTNKLVEAATYSEAGVEAPVEVIFQQIRQKHQETISTIIHSAAERAHINRKMDELLEEGTRLCQGTMMLRELTPRSRDAISALGERLSAPMIAAALIERGMASEAIEATELVVTDSSHGSADPFMDLTRERCEIRLRPLLDEGVIPVVTGFIGASTENVLTTLGRGGSDYSATILGAALRADEVIIWTDVDGLQTADPRLVAGACTISEISYREAAELAYFGAKVLHPKTLRAVMESGIPLWIRNTFAPERPGTKITPAGPPSASGVKALTATQDVVLISVGGPGMAGVSDALGRTFRITAAVRADVLLISQSSSQNDLCLVIPSALAKPTVEALRHEFAHELTHQKTESITVDSTVAMVAVVGQSVRGTVGFVGRTFKALDQVNVDTIAMAQGSTDSTLSFVIAKTDVKAALNSIHREFQLGMSGDGISYETPYPSVIPSLAKQPGY